MEEVWWCEDVLQFQDLDSAENSEKASFLHPCHDLRLQSPLVLQQNNGPHSTASKKKTSQWFHRVFFCHKAKKIQKKVVFLCEFGLLNMYFLSDVILLIWCYDVDDLNYLNKTNKFRTGEPQHCYALKFINVME